MNPIRVGVVGANPDESWASLTHLPALQALPQFDLRAVSTTRRETAERAATQFGAALAFDNALELVNHPDVDMVTVAVKAPEHRAVVLAALEAGKHVYCEWPFGINSAEGIEMAELARRRGVRTAAGLQGRTSPWMAAIRKIVADGTLGEILSTSVVASGFVFGGTAPSRYAYLLDPKGGATMLRSPFCHLFDSVLHTLGEPTELSSRLVTRRHEVHIADTGETLPQRVADQIVVTTVLADGAVASLHMRGGVSRGTNLLWEINGTEGDLLVTAAAILTHMGPLRLQMGRGAETALVDVPVADDVPDVPASLKGGMAFNIACFYAQFARDIREGTHLCPDFDEAVRRHKTLDLVARASDEGCRWTR